MRRGAIILCGGNSTRMGTAKALLPFGPELMLERVVRLVGEVVPPDNIVVVAAQQQNLPKLPDGVLIARDANENRGPLEGLAAGLHMLAERADVVYATGCDVPLLVPAFIERMFALLGGHAIAVPRDGKFYHPLAAVYRVSVLKHVQQLLAADRLRPFFLFQELDTLEIPVVQLRQVDPNLATLENLNCPEDYRKAFHAIGFNPPT
ncbi:MAG: molybdenum cofactor guanylyltransferase [Planctomycetes bacterium]|nr:molybdenum cofactor guanylyltransferase [Planctomycetota bacterium]